MDLLLRIAPEQLEGSRDPFFTWASAPGSTTGGGISVSSMLGAGTRVWLPL